MLEPSLSPGTPFPWVVARSSVNSKFHFSSAAGRYNVLCFFATAGEPFSQQVLNEFFRYHVEANLFDLDNFLFTGVSIDPDDERLGRLTQQVHGIRWFWDFDQSISRQVYASDPSVGNSAEARSYGRQVIVLDERLRVLRIFPFRNSPTAFVREVVDYLRSLPLLDKPALANVQAPILVVPRLFEPELCAALIAHYEQQGGKDSGFMREVDGQTVLIKDYNHKRRTDCEITDPALRQACMTRIHNRLVPEIHKAFQFQATRMERYIVACYDASTCDHFMPHRDNTTKGTAHRRFAVSLVLNTGQFEGGYLRFPEFGRHLYAPPAGGAVVFSCSLLHEATPVTSGKRYVFLPFLYDDAAAQIRQENLKYISISQSSQ